MRSETMALEAGRLPQRPIWVTQETPPAAQPRVLRAAHILSGAIAALMIVSSAIGLLVGGLYTDEAWGREALRGGDLVTLLLAVPLLIGTLVMSRRGSRGARAAWVGLLAYSVYNYAYYVFGAAFNDIFLLHIALFSMSVFALASALWALDRPAIADRFRRAWGARWVGLFLAVVGILQGGLWVFVLVRNAVSGELIANIPVDGQHLVFALDLGLLVPSLVLAGVLLVRRTPFGFLFGTGMAVLGAVYQVNLMMAGVFAENAGVAGAKAFPADGLFLTGAFLLASVLLFLPHRSSGRHEDETRASITRGSSEAHEGGE